MASLALGLSGSLLLSGCRNDRVSVNPKDLRSPQFAYRLDELALLQMAADDIQDLERKKEYGKIYDDYGSDELKNSISRRRFLIISNCVENDLGDMLEFDSTNLGFRRETLPHGKTPLDTLTRKVERTQEVINEQLVFINTGINFKLNSIYWIARDKQFLECVANSPLVEANMEPQQEGVPVQPGEQPTAETPATGTETGQQPTEQQASTPGSTAEPVKTEQPATPGQPEVAPVQELKPGELKKEAPAAKPAGAGAVFDTRPAPPPKPEKPADNGTDQPSEEDERQGGVDD